MRKNFRRLSVLLVGIFSVLYTNAQRTSDHNTIGWYTTTITPKISDKWSGHLEYQWRRTDWIKSWQQSLLRAGMSYKIEPNVSAQVGYGWIKTFNYGEFPIAAAGHTFDEHRIYEQIATTSKYGKVSVSNRLRLEQRWLAVYADANATKIDRWNYLNRIRFMPRVDVPIGQKGWYAAVYDEIMIGFGKNIGQNTFDQNRVGILGGIKINDQVRIEAGYLNQTVKFGRQVNQNNVMQYNDGIILNTYFNIGKK